MLPSVRQDLAAFDSKRQNSDPMAAGLLPAAGSGVAAIERPAVGPRPARHERTGRRRPAPPSRAVPEVQALSWQASARGTRGSAECPPPGGGGCGESTLSGPFAGRGAVACAAWRPASPSPCGMRRGLTVPRVSGLSRSAGGGPSRHRPRISHPRRVRSSRPGRRRETATPPWRPRHRNSG